MDSPAIDRDFSEYRRPNSVVLPEIVVDHLKMPDPLSCLSIDRYEAVRKKVMARTVTTEIGSSRGGKWHIYKAEFLVRAEAAPRSQVPGIFPRVLTPRVDT